MENPPHLLQILSFFGGVPAGLKGTPKENEAILTSPIPNKKGAWIASCRFFFFFSMHFTPKTSKQRLNKSSNLAIYLHKQLRCSFAVCSGQLLLQHMSIGSTHRLIDPSTHRPIDPSTQRPSDPSACGAALTGGSAGASPQGGRLHTSFLRLRCFLGFPR